MEKETKKSPANVRGAAGQQARTAVSRRERCSAVKRSGDAERRSAVRLVKKFHVFMEAESLLSCSQERSLEP
jgi:hypothetical protein